MKYISAAAALLGATQGKAMTGTCVGGWMVLEPWITPSLFYRFLGKTKDEGVGIDSYTLCEALGPEEGNKVMRQHWDDWMTEDHVKALADRGVEMIRLPIGDWTLEPYGPYVGCMDGAEDKIQWMFDMCNKYGIKILLDVHAMKDSQNGFDNSGQTNLLIWNDQSHYSHWPNAAANWMGDWDWKTGKYTKMRPENMQRALRISENLLKRWGQNPAFAAFEPINEPWWNSPLDVLKDFYREVRKLVQKHTKPGTKFVFHNAFNYWNIWNDMFEDNDHADVVMDHHYYQAWNDNMNTTKQFCDDYERNALTASKDIKYDVWWGEWALATDTCAMWLGGFNDGNKMPQQQCKKVDCPRTYMKKHGTDFNRTAEILGPFGTFEKEKVSIMKGQCNTDSSFFSDDEVRTIAKCALASMDKHIQGSFFWTAHNEIEEKWDYIRAWDNKWIDKPLNKPPVAKKQGSTEKGVIEELSAAWKDTSAGLEKSFGDSEQNKKLGGAVLKGVTDRVSDDWNKFFNGFTQW